VKKRFADLFKKFKDNSLSRPEYDEFMELLGREDLSELDNLLIETWQELDTESMPVRQSKQIRPYIWKAAAAAVLLIVGSLAVWDLLPFHANDDEYITYHASFGEVREISLPDGSVISLNANSEISWYSDWKSLKQRTVLLKGEAFFDIQSLPGRIPFIVKTGDVTLEVVGTSFNVNHRTETVDIYLDEGSLNVHFDGGETNTIALVPGDLLQVNPEKKEVDLAPNHTLIQAAAWKKGVLNFRDLTLAEVLVKLTHIYGKQFISADSSLLQKELYLGVPYSDWETVRQALELSLDIRFVEKESYVELEFNP